jgi:hypothetical protein
MRDRPSKANGPEKVSKAQPLKIPRFLKKEEIVNKFIFMSYSHERPDSKRLDEIRIFMKPLQSVVIFYDVDIPMGSRWEMEISDALQKCTMGVLLISDNFLGSKFITQTELPTLIARAKSFDVKLAPLLLSECLYEQYGLDALQFLNPVNKPINSMKPEERRRYYKILAREIQLHCGRN